MTSRSRVGLWAATVAVLALFVGLRFEIGTDVAHFLPAEHSEDRALLARAMLDSPASRNLALALRGAPLPELRRAQAALAEGLAEHPDVSTVRIGPRPEEALALQELYRPVRNLLIPAPALGAEAAQGVVDRLSLPLPAEARAAALDDPFDQWPAFLSRLRNQLGRGVRVEQGRFVSRDRTAMFVFVRTTRSPLDFGATAPLMDWLDAQEVALGVRLVRAGVHPHAVTAERSVRRAVRRISSLTVPALLLLLLFALGRRGVALAVLPAGVGALAGLAAVLLLYGSVHGLTLAFGSALLGVCVDYPIHLVVHQRLLGGPPEVAARQVRVGLLLGAGTTVAGFAGLFLTGLPGLREIALFASVGVVVALGCTLHLLPGLMSTTSPPRWAAPPAGLWSRGWAVACLVVVGLLAGLGLPRLVWDDSLSALSRPDPHVVSEEQEVRRLLEAEHDDLRAVVVGDAARAQHDAALREAVDQGLVDSISGPSLLLPAEPLVRPSRADAERWRSSLLSAGLTEAAVAWPPPDAPLPDYAALLERDLTHLVDPYRVPFGDSVAWVTELHGVRDRDALEAHLDGPGFLFDPARFLDGIYAEYRQRTSRLVLGGLVAVLMVLIARYRRWRLVLAALGPAVGGAAAAMGLLGLLGVPATLLHLAAALLVLAVGVDFGVFLTEQRQAAPRSTLWGLTVAATSTLLGFGALFLGGQPSLEALGSVVGVGVGVALRGEGSERYDAARDRKGRSDRAAKRLELRQGLAAELNLQGAQGGLEKPLKEGLVRGSHGAESRDPVGRGRSCSSPGCPSAWGVRLFIALVLLHPLLAALGMLLTPWAPVLAGLSLVSMVVVVTAHPGWAVFGPAISRGDSDDTVALTFDDGPHPDSTPALLEALRKVGGRATFFVLVDRAEQHPALLQAIAAEHEVALHGPAHHPWATMWHPDRGARELTEACGRLTELCGQAVRWYRPPFGVTSPRLVESVRRVGLRTIWCSVRTLDGGLRGDGRVRAACQATRGGDIVLLHEGPRAAARLLPEVLEDLGARGLQCVTIGELLASQR